MPLYTLFIFFFFNDTATTEIYTLSLHDALPICTRAGSTRNSGRTARARNPLPTKNASKATFVTVKILLRRVPAPTPRTFTAQRNPIRRITAVARRAARFADGTKTTR